MARSRTRMTAGLLSVVALCLLVASAASGRSGATTDESPKLGKHDRGLIARAEAAGRENVTLLLATKEGQTEAAANAIESAGGEVAYRDNEVGYLRVEMPLDRVEAVERIDSIEAADVDEVLQIPDPRPQGIAPIPIPQPPPGADTPNDNPYMPIRDIGASQFLAENPTWDGRGVTIGVLDTGIDLEHPSLQRTSTNERKIVDWVTGTNPLEPVASLRDPTWIHMATQVTAENFQFTVGGVTYRAPRRNGAFNFGTFNEADPLFGGEYSVLPTPGGDLNRDGDESDVFPILQDGNQVWVDTNQNRSFDDEEGLRPYRRNFDVDFFGQDNPGTPIRERVPFVVQIEQVTVGGAERTYVNIGIVSGAHGSHVAGIAAGHALFGGPMSGAAPGAKLVSVRACLFVTGCTSHALTEGMIYAVRRANVDVVNMSIGGLPALNDGNNARCELYNRLIERQGVQFFFSQGNSGPGVNTAGDPAVCTKVMAVGAYISRETYARNYGVDEPYAIPYEDNLLYFSSRGPREDGGFKPQILATGAAISTTPLWQPGSPVPGTYPLPPGYSMFNGTSMSAPQATGGAALLISAAKATGLRQYEPPKLRQAINSSARWIEEGDRYVAYDQGNGLMNVPAAWELLRQRIEPVEIQAAVPVATVLGAFLQPANTGTGIYDREGVTPGVSYIRTYTLTRTTGSNQPITYNLSWVGNDGTFSTAGSVSLDRNRPASLNVHINPTVGSHSAILNFDDPSTPGIEFQTMNTVIAPYTFGADNNYSVEVTGEAGRGQQLHYFFRIPAGTPAFKVDFSGPSEEPGTGQARFLRWRPDGLPNDDNSVSSCYLPPQPPVNPCNPSPPNPAEWGNNPSSRTVLNPMAGVWEVTVDARRTSDADFAPFQLTATVLGASISPNPDIIESATIGEPIEREYTISNLFGAFTGRAAGTDLGSARLGRFTIAHHETQEYDTTIPAGATRFRATIGNPSDPAADLDLFVFRCTPTCVLVAQSADGDSEESVTINNPAAGLWKVVVDGFDVPAGTTQYDYVDVFHKVPPFGTITVDDADALRPAGSTWTVTATILVNEAPAEGRVLLGNIEVRTDENLVIGSSNVIIQDVS
jgi:hypothetical protein